MIPAIFSFITSGALSWGYGFLLAFAVIAFVYPVVRREQILVNFLLQPSFWLLAAFGAFYVGFDEISFHNVFYYFLLPLAAYGLGWCSFEQSGRTPEAARDHILGIALGFGLYACLNFLVNTGSTRGQLIDFWSGEYRAATGSGFLITMIFAAAVYTLFLEKRRPVKLLILAITGVCLLYMFVLGSRTQLLILATVTAAGFALLLREKGQTGWGLLGLAVILLAALVCYDADLLGLRGFVDDSNLLARFVGIEELHQSDSQRVRQFLLGLENLYLNPFGGQKADFYYHNLWLDISRVSGLIPMAFMLDYHLITTVHALRLFRDKWLDAGARYIILCVYLGVLINFFMEPVLEGCLHFFLAFCAVNGIVDGLYREQMEAQ